jgi:hypothetical protein
VSAVLRLAVWLLEILGEACGTCLVICLMAFWQARYVDPPLQNDLSLSKLVGINLFILFEFAMIGYFATTLIARFTLRDKRQQLYPYISALLYLLHSSIFFIAVGNSLLESGNLAIQLGGSLVAFACTWLGNLLLSRTAEKVSGALMTRYEGG